jgi:chromosome segregation ATPase
VTDPETARDDGRQAWINERYGRLNDAVEHVEEVVQEKFARLDDKISATEKALSIAAMAANKAIDKAEAAQQLRFAGLNEFNERINQMTRTFSTNEAAEATRKFFESRLENLEKDIEDLADERVSKLENWRSRATGVGSVLILVSGVIGGIIVRLLGRG